MPLKPYNANTALARAFDNSNDTLKVADIPASGGGQGSKNVTTPATPVQLDAAACAAIVITARPGNTGRIAWGFSAAVRATVGAEIGALLEPGASVAIPVTDTSKIFIDAVVAGNGVAYTFVTR